MSHNYPAFRAAFRGVIHADGYAGFNELFVGGQIAEAGCWAHVRRKFFDVHAATTSPIAKEALDRIGQLYHVEETINGAAADHRRRECHQRSKPIAEALAEWADETVGKLSRKSELAAAFRYMRGRWPALVRCFNDGRLALDKLSLALSISEYIAAARRPGARGYFLSHAERQIVTAIETLLRGSSYFSAKISETLLEGFLRSARPTDSGSATPRLTARAREVLQLLAEGHRNKTIAQKLGSASRRSRRTAPC